MLCFANTQQLCDAVDGFRLRRGDTLHVWWTTASLEFMHTTSCGTYARTDAVPAYADPLDIRATESWGASLSPTSVDILRAILHDSLGELDDDEVGFGVNHLSRGILVGRSFSRTSFVPAQEVFRAKPPMLESLKRLSAGPYLIRLREDVKERFQDLEEFAHRSPDDRVYVLVDLRDAHRTGFHVLRKTGYGDRGVEFTSRSFDAKSSRRSRKKVPHDPFVQNPEGWVRLNLTTLVEELQGLDTSRGLLMSVEFGTPRGVLFRQVSRQPRWVFVMQNRWVPEDVDYAECGATESPAPSRSSIS